MGNTSLIIVYHIKKKPKYRIVFEFLNLMTLSPEVGFFLTNTGKAFTILHVEFPKRKTKNHNNKELFIWLQ